MCSHSISVCVHVHIKLQNYVLSLVSSSFRSYLKLHLDPMNTICDNSKCIGLKSQNCVISMWYCKNVEVT